ncbi:MAG: lipase [Verrucomicrobia bacterium Tous-C9LFEB]|nr:MAG: lipase [Verrucomicrobia bacterium Tous-C9LFEB]
MKMLSICFLLASVALACASIVPERDISYLGAERAEKMDAYLPSNSFKRPVPAILFIHGGGWRNGDKAGEREVRIATTLAENGYAVFSINYKMNIGERDASNKLHLSYVAWPQNFYDCKSALRFLRSEATRFGIDPARIGVMGGSAGAHLAMLVGVTTNHEEFNREGLYLDQSNKVACVVDLYGVSDLRGKKITPFTGSEFNRVTSYEEKASPVTYLTKETPPFFIAHGTADKVIPVEESRILSKSLEYLGVPYEYIEIPEAPHAFDLQPPQKDLRPEVLAFLRKYLRSSSSQQK